MQIFENQTILVVQTEKKLLQGRKIRFSNL